MVSVLIVLVLMVSVRMVLVAGTSVSLVRQPGSSLKKPAVEPVSSAARRGGGVRWQRTSLEPMTTMKPASWAYAEEFVPENEVQEKARLRGGELGISPVGHGTGPALRMLAAASQATSVIEIGTGSGTSGLWLLAGMPDNGVLTTIDLEVEHQVAAREAFAAAGIPHQRTRVIGGRALDVLPRMTDGAYDLVLIDADKTEYPAYTEHAIRLLRPGGVLALDNMLWHNQVADPAARDEKTVTLRDLGKELRERDDLLVAMLPVGDGLLVCIKK